MGGRGGGAPGNANRSESTAPAPSAPTSLQGQIRSAYAKLGGEPDEPVRLADLRRELASIPRVQLDAALLALDSRRVGVLIPESKQSLLTTADRAAAISIGGEEKHLLRLARS